MVVIEEDELVFAYPTAPALVLFIVGDSEAGAVAIGDEDTVHFPS